MKRFLIVLAAAMFVVSCNNSAEVAGANDTKGDSTNAAATNTQHIKDVYEAIQTGDVTKIRDIIADDFVDHNANMDNSDLKGKDSCLKMLSQIHTYFEPGMKMEYMGDATSADGTMQYSMVRMTGKAIANPWGMPVGSNIDDISVDVVKIKDGKATDHWGFMSMKDFNEIMGMMQGGNNKK